MHLPEIKLPKLPESVTVRMGMTRLKLKEASPEILLGLGIVTMGAAVVSGIMAARNHDILIADHEERLENAKSEYVLPTEDLEELDIEGPDEEGNYVLSDGVIVERKSEKEIAKAVRKEYFRTLARLIRLYGPTVALMLISTGCFIGMHNIQAGRIAGLSGAYTGLKEAFDIYQKRNIELNGQKNHEMCKYGWKEVETEEEDPDTGEIVKEKTKVPLYEGLDSEEMAKQPFHDQFHVFNEKTATNCTGNANADICTLNACDNFIKCIVNARGWAVVNDALDYLGMDRTAEGMIEGWVKGCGEEPSIGFEDPINNRFLAGYNHEDVYLDFNVHGNVFALLKKKKEEDNARMEELHMKRIEEEQA